MRIPAAVDAAVERRVERDQLRKVVRRVLDGTRRLAQGVKLEVERLAGVDHDTDRDAFRRRDHPDRKVRNVHLGSGHLEVARVVRHRVEGPIAQERLADST